MTARVCPVHGEYAPTGICRWCEAPAETVELPGVAGQWRKPDRVEWKDGVPSYFWDLGTFTVPNPKYVKILATYKPEFLNRIGFTAIHLPTAADLPIQPPVVLEYQHAALRWERVARRWGAKHRPWTLLEIAVESDRFIDKLIAGYIPKEWP